MKRKKKNEAVLSETCKLIEYFNVQSDVAKSTESKSENTEFASHCTYETTVSDEATFSISDTVVEEIAIPPNLAISCCLGIEFK